MWQQQLVLHRFLKQMGMLSKFQKRYKYFLLHKERDFLVKLICFNNQQNCKDSIQIERLLRRLLKLIILKLLVYLLKLFLDRKLKINKFDHLQLQKVLLK